MAFSIIKVAGKTKTPGELRRDQTYFERGKHQSTERHYEPPPAWRDALRDLRQEMTAGNVEQWLAPAQVRQDGDDLVISLPDEFSRHWVENRLDRRIHGALEHTGHGDLSITYEVRPPDTEPGPGTPRRVAGHDDWVAFEEQRLAALGITPRQGHLSERYNSVLGIHYVLTASPEWFKEHPQDIEPWIQHSVAFMERLHGAANLYGAYLHEDQTTLHLHVEALPIDDRGRLNAGAFVRTPEQLEQLHTKYNAYLRAHDIQLERGTNARLERSLAAAPPSVREMALRLDGIPLDDVLHRLEGEQDTRDPHRWFLGDRIIQVHEDQHGFTEHSPHGALDGRGAIDLVVRLRQEGTTPLEQHGLAVGYLAALHPEHLAHGAPPLVPPAPQATPPPAIERTSMPFGTHSRWEPGQFLVVDSATEAEEVLHSAKGWGRVAVAGTPEELPVDELDEAVAKGWMVDVASRSERVWQAVQDRYPEQADAPGSQLWRSASAKGHDTPHTLEHDRTHDIGPDMMMG